MVGFDEIWCYVLVLWVRVFVVCGGVYWKCVALCIGSMCHVVLCGVKIGIMGFYVLMGSAIIR